MQIDIPQIDIPDTGPYWLDGVSLAPEVSGIAGNGLIEGSILVEGGKIARISAGSAPQDGKPRVAGQRRIVLPRFVDIHTHLDKGHIWTRAPNPDGTFMGALTTVKADREANWSREDIEKRMRFALECAYFHGTGAIRTHLDSLGGQSDISWPTFDSMRREWQGRIALQAVALFPTLVALEDPADFASILRNITKFGGVLGGVTYRGEPLDQRFDRALDLTIEAAKANGLDLDFHVDESASEDARTLERIADAVLKHKFTGKVLVGHCCSLALMDDQDRARVINKLGEAKIAVVSLPMCNMYLQDRVSGRTPRWRGVAPLHELDAVGVSTMVSSDNTRDPFYAYGDLDCVEVFREATRILHFDHTSRPWLEAITRRPADVMGLDGGVLTSGKPADYVLFSARTMSEFLSRPQSDRQVVVAGKKSDAHLPEYSTLDSNC